ncbi:hypothetical protein HMPREF3217_00127 [Finegoldia magna]|nr:hypothetical protein HMPREF3217_00127 [Finegoldia magna]
MSFTKVTGKNALTQKYSYSKSTMDELYKIRKNYGIYMGNEMERYRLPIYINYFVFLMIYIFNIISWKVLNI